MLESCLKTLEFLNVGDLIKKRDKLLIGPNDSNMNYLMNALYTPLDMTDYESNFVSLDDKKDGFGVGTPYLMRPMMEEIIPPEPMRLYIHGTEENTQPLARSKIHREYIDNKAAEEEAAAEEEEEEEEEGGEEEGEGEEGAEGGEEAAEEEEEEEKPAVNLPSR